MYKPETKIESPSTGKAIINNVGDNSYIGIPTKKNWFIILFLGAWLGGWFIGESFALNTLLNNDIPNSANTFIIFWLIGWTVGGLFAALIFFWQVAGIEHINIERKTIEIGRSIFNIKMSKTYDLRSVSNIDVNPQPRGDFPGLALARDFYGLRGGTLKFDYGLKSIRFANGIDEVEARMLIEKFRANSNFTEENFARQESPMNLSYLFIFLLLTGCHDEQPDQDDNSEWSEELRVDISNFTPEEIETRISEEITKLPEFQESVAYIDSLTNGELRMVLMFDEPEEGDAYHIVRVGVNSEARFETYYIFYVDPQTLEIMIEDVIQGDIVDMVTWRKREELRKEAVDILISENSLNSLSLPLPERDMLQDLQDMLIGYTVTKEIGQQDGPDFPLYSISAGDEKIGHITMDYADTLVTDAMYLYSTKASDEYELKVGDTYETLKEKRGTGRIGFDPYHFHVYLYFKNSNIQYELTGELAGPDPVPEDLGDIVLTDKDIEGWTIQYIIWRKRPQE